MRGLSIYTALILCGFLGACIGQPPPSDNHTNYHDLTGYDSDATLPDIEELFAEAFARQEALEATLDNAINTPGPSVPRSGLQPATEEAPAPQTPSPVNPPNTNQVFYGSPHTSPGGSVRRPMYIDDGGSSFLGPHPSSKFRGWHLDAQANAPSDSSRQLRSSGKVPGYSLMLT